MFTFASMISSDTLLFTMELRTRKVRMTADELEDFIRELSVSRSNMTPPVADKPLTSTTVASVIPCSRWEVGLDLDAPSQVRLSLLHRGFGWLWLPLSGRQAAVLIDALQRALRLRPGAPRD